MSTTETTLSRIFSICDHVSHTGHAIRCPDTADMDARCFLGVSVQKKGDWRVKQSGKREKSQK